jgi:thymidylate synthase
MAARHPEHQYLDLMRELIESGDKQVDADHGTVTYSAFGRQHRWDLADGFPLLTTKKVFWKGVVRELHWFASGQTNVSYLTRNGVHIWDDYPYRYYREKMERGDVPELSKEAFVQKLIDDDAFAKEYGELPHIYGEMWRGWIARDGRRVDQLSWALDEITRDPSAHNTLVSSWNPEYLYSMANPGEACRFPICHNLYQFNVKNGRLCLQLYQRTADIFLGVPFNIASYALLLLVAAKVTGYEPGEFIHTFGDVHIYENHIDAAREQLAREPTPLPTVSVDADLNTIDDFQPEQVVREGYDPHPSIKADLVVSGGYSEHLHAGRHQHGTNT